MKIQINPNKEFVQTMRKALKDNDNYCPCSIAKSEETKCMCKEFREQDAGVCHCGLYTKIVEGE
jgi:Ferredoxin thioredoxin reductase catalytic beta chain.